VAKLLSRLKISKISKYKPMEGGKGLAKGAKFA
jgi:hypothetical protein